MYYCASPQRQSNQQLSHGGDAGNGFDNANGINDASEANGAYHGYEADGANGADRANTRTELRRYTFDCLHLFPFVFALTGQPTEFARWQSYGIRWPPETQRELQRDTMEHMECPSGLTGIDCKFSKTRST